MLERPASTPCVRFLGFLYFCLVPFADKADDNLRHSAELHGANGVVLVTLNRYRE
jgi:hypothetical protein